MSAKSASGVEVHELGGGTSSIAFDYRIMAKRLGHENERLLDVTEQMKKQAALQAKLAPVKQNGKSPVRKPAPLRMFALPR